MSMFLACAFCGDTAQQLWCRTCYPLNPQSFLCGLHGVEHTQRGHEVALDSEGTWFMGWKELYPPTLSDTTDAKGHED